MITYVKYVAGLLLLLVLGLVMMIVIRFRNDAQIPYTVSTAGITIPTYDEIELDFTHHYVEPTSIPATCGAAIDLDSGAEELFLCGGQGQNDAIFRYENGTYNSWICLSANQGLLYCVQIWESYGAVLNSILYRYLLCS